MTASLSSLHDFHGTIHLVSSSHWDREWYLPFQKFRGKLVAMLDAVLNELESGRLPFYQLDGQFIPVEDYLQIRPEKEELIRQLVAQGRFKIGPWYNLPDAFLVSGESIVRNFLLGMKRAEAFGQTSKIGWLCDIFGHNSQMPQLLMQLGIDNAILWRGVDLKVSNPFLWESPDGTRVLGHRFPENGYTDFDFDVRRANKPDIAPSVDEMAANAHVYFKKTRTGNEGGSMLWFDGGDHMEFDPAVIDMARKINQEAGREIIKSSTLDAFIEALRIEAPDGMTIVKGELREPASMGTYGWLIPGVGSSRIPLKQANHEGETFLTLWLEPWCAAANFALGIEYPARAIELAWEYLLKNHPHDSICGCSPDETHSAMPYRFEQSRQIAEFYRDKAFTALAAEAVRGRVEQGEIALSLFAAAGGTTRQIPEAFVKLPKDWPQFSEFFGFELKPSLRLYDLAGQEVPYQLLQVQPSTTHLRVPPNHFPASEERQGIRIAIDTALAPATMQNFVMKRREGPTRISRQNTIGVGRNTLRNEFLEVTALSDGTLSLLDLKSGRKYDGLLAMEDTADIGDGWFHGIALQDRAFLSTGGNVTFGIFENGPLLARLHIRVEWQVPAEFDFRTNQRSAKLEVFVVEHLVTLRKNNAHLEIDTTVHNQTRDHRLRIFCPTGLHNIQHFSTDTPFDAVERPVKLRADNHLLREIQIEMTPQQNWIAATDGSHGLALLAPGQYESAVLDQPDRPLCVTLLRAFRRAVFTEGNEGGQIQGIHRFRMALKPIGSHVPATDLFHLAQILATSPQAIQLESRDFRYLPESRQGMETPRVRLEDRPSVEGKVVFSACYLVEGAHWVFRLFNPAHESTPIRLTGGAKWQITDLRGENAKEVPGFEIIARPRQILTLRALPGKCLP